MITIKPKLIGRVIRDGDVKFSKCCHSSYYKKWGIFRTKYCINPQCNKYYKNFLNKGN